MNNKMIFFTADKAGLMLSTVLLVTLTGCVGYVDGPRAGVYVAPPVVEIAAPADYIYYPGYDVYYNSNAHQYAYLDGGVWVSRPSFPGASVDVLLASPSVRMDFHDSPANHHAEMARQYPRNWAPSGGRQVEKAPVRKPQVKKAAPKAEKRDEHAEK